MNLVFKFKVLGFFAAIILGGVLHIVFYLMPGKKFKADYPDYPEISLGDDPRY